ncbi:PAS domain S-box protein [candidate division GN15 bacterium]|nr:PAS domain S-box protein [candidate division GN15 bacterium]
MTSARLNQAKEPTGVIGPMTTDQPESMQDFSDLPIPYQSLDTNGQILAVNEHWLQLLGYEADEVIGRWFGDFLSERCREHFLTCFPRLKADGLVRDVELELRDGTGATVFVLLNGKAVYNVAGDFVRSHCLMQDVTRQREVERELRDNEEKFQQLAANINELFWLRSRDRMLYISPAYERMFQRSSEQLSGKPDDFLHSVHPDDQEMVADANAREWAEGRPMDIEFRTIRNDGSIRWISAKTSLIRDDQDNVYRSAGIAEDITERKLAEQALEESIQRFRNIVEAAEAGYFFVDTEGRYGYVNRAWLRMYKYDFPQEVIGRPFSITQPESGNGACDLDLPAMLASEDGFQCDCARQCKDGSIGYHLVSGNRVIVDGRVIGIEGFLFDTTERKKAEDALRESEERFRAAFETSPDAIAIARTSDGLCVTVNKGFVELTGYTREEVIGQTSIDLNVWVDTADRERFVARLEDEGYVDDFIVRFRRKDGSELVGDVSARMVMIQGVTHSLVMVRDITQRQRTEQALSRRDRILSAIASVANLLLDSEELHSALTDVLTVLGRATDVSRCYIFENVEPKAGRPACSQRAEWAAPGVSAEIDNPELQNATYDDLGMTRWLKILPKHQTIAGPVELLPPEEQRILRSQDIQSIAIVPVFVGDSWWGFMGFDECRTPREWSDSELDALRSAAGIVGSVIERSRFTEALKQSENRFRSLVEDVPGIAVQGYDSDRRVIFWNRASELLYGYSAEEASGQQLEDLIIPESMRDEVVTAVDNWVNRGIPIPAGELMLRRRDGSPVAVHSSHTMLTAPDGRRELYCLDLDLTEQKRAEAALRESEEKFREIAQMLPEAVYECDINGMLTFANKKALEYFGYEPDDFYFGICSTNMICEEERELAITNQRRILAGEHLGPIEYTAVRKDGSTFPMSVHSTRIVQHGEVVGNRGIILDMSDRKAREEEQLRSQKLESLGILAGGIAHDFNNLLTGILGNISVALMSMDSVEELHDGLREAERAAVRARELTMQLLTFSKGGQPVKKTVCLKDIVRDSVSFALRGSNVLAIYDMTDQTATADADAGQISQVIHNLALNADQAMPDGGTLRVGLETVDLDAEGTAGRAPGRYVRITMTDEGHGIPAHYLPRIFDPYFTTKQSGNGLGLATSYSIVKKHGGHIDVSSETGRGTTFTLYLPASDERIEATTPTREAPVTGTGRLLVMDDEQYIRDLAVRILSKHGFEVDEAPDGARAVAMYEQAQSDGTPYRAVILDLTVPGGLGGEETVARLRQVDPQVRAIVCSGYSNDPIVARHRDFGFTGTVAKPYKPSELLQTVREALVANPPQPARTAK